MTGREVARLVRAGSQPSANAALRRLAEEGLVRAEEAGNAYLYTFNRAHLGAPAVELLASIRTELERRLRTEIADWEIAPAHVSIFGSAARGDGDTRSDIDIFVVRPVDVAEDDPGWRDQLGRLADVVYDWTGNHAALSEVSAADIRRLRRERPPVIDELRRDAIALAGPDPAELLEGVDTSGDERKDRESHAWEQEADRFAARILIPPEHDSDLRRLTLTDIPEFAERLGIAPGIVVGRLQHERLIPNHRGNELRHRLAFSD